MLIAMRAIVCENYVVISAEAGVVNVNGQERKFSSSDVRVKGYWHREK